MCRSGCHVEPDLGHGRRFFETTVERRAAERGAIAVRIAVREKVIEKRTHEIQRRPDRRKAPAKPAPAVAAETVLSSPRACRSVLEGLTKQTRAGDLNRGESAPTVRAAIQFLRALRDANLLG